jgi:cell division protein FtsQ
MDGGRRLPGSLREWLRPRLDDAAQHSSDDGLSGRRSLLAFGRSGFRLGSVHVPARPGIGVLATLGFLVIMGGAGWFAGGHQAALRNAHGSVADIAARAFGFPIRSVDVTGVKELTKEEVLAASGMAPSGSLLFLDLADVRAKVKALPLVAEATVRKLYPDRVDIRIVEREPYALWQQDGVISVVSVDGTVIDSLRDKRYLRLPHVVGPGARLRVKEYAEILDGVPELRGQIRAGTLISERRWTIKMTNGIDIKLPEEKPLAALREFERLNREAQILSKDIIAVDMRIPGRVAVRLTEDSAAQRREHFEKTLPKVKGRA